MRNQIVFVALLSVGLLHAQEEPVSTTPEPFPYENYLNKHSVAIHGGLVGYGLEYAYNINKNLNIRLGVNYFALSGISIPYTLDDRDVDILLGADALDIDLLLEYLPFDRSAFKLVGGLAYINNTQGDATIKLQDGLDFGDIPLDPDDVGELGINMKYSGLAPYLAMGFGRAVPKGRVGFGIEFGAYYVGSPEVSLRATELFEPTANETEEAKLEEALSSLVWLPNIKLKIAVRL